MYNPFDRVGFGELFKNRSTTLPPFCPMKITGGIGGVTIADKCTLCGLQIQTHMYDQLHKAEHVFEG
ncbi:MAG TPA: hypothetical protein VJO14_02905 [Bacteroidota bacterium]|nr:hypothetical protein [Bacteroidota bacterium]